MNEWERKSFDHLMRTLDTVNEVIVAGAFCLLAGMCFHVSKHICAKIFH